MSSQTIYSRKPKCLYSAIFITLFSISGTSYAVNFGKTSIHSSQHEPLSASISVKDINTDNFKVSLANNSTYKQMGLTPNSNITVQFQPTSKDSGKIVLRSNVPINDPFADIVLDVRNNDKKQFMPKTLLMPMDDKSRVDISSNTVVDNTTKPNLPTTSPVKDEANKPKDSAVLTASTTINDPKKSDNSGESAEASRQAFLEQQEKENQQAKNNPSKPVENTATSETKASTAKATTPVENTVKKSPEKEADTNKTASTTKKTPSKNTTTKTQKPAKNTKKPKASTKTHSKPSSKAGKGRYVVQRNDNLWTIASEIAQQNNANVHTVMRQIQQINPRAFSRGKASMLIANKTLALPDYDVIPSQNSLEEAIAAKRASIKGGKSTASRPASTQAKGKKTEKKDSKTAGDEKTNSQAKVSLVAPKAGSKNEGQQSNGDQKSNNPLVVKLKENRETVAKKATQVKKLNDQVGSYTQKLHLQNKKLAELEARLKKLKGQ